MMHFDQSVITERTVLLRLAVFWVVLFCLPVSKSQQTEQESADQISSPKTAFKMETVVLMVLYTYTY